MLQFTVNNQELTKVKGSTPATDSQNYLKAQFTFSEEWANCDRIAIFRADDVVRKVYLDENNECLVPWEVLSQKEHGNFCIRDTITLYATVYATDNTKQIRITTNEVKFDVKKSGYTETAGSSEVPPDVNTHKTTEINANSTHEQYATAKAVFDYGETKTDKTSFEKLKEDTEVTKTATGNAITIDSAKAPLAVLKLYGKTTQNGTPTPSAPVPLVSVGDSGSFEVGLFGGKNLFDGITEKGHTTGTAISNRVRSKNLIPITKGQKYTITKYDDTNNEIYFAINTSATQKAYPFSGTVLNECGNSSVWNNVTTYSFTATQNGVMALLFSKSDGNDIVPNDVENIKFQVEMGNSTEYEPCNKQTLTMPYNLQGIRNVKCEIDFNRGVHIQKFCYTRATSVILGFLGAQGTHFTGELYTNAKASDNSKYGAVLCNIAENVPADVQYTTNTRPATISISNSGRVQIAIEGITTLADLNAYLSENEVYVVYELVTPIETPLTETELNAYRQLLTNKGTTTILSEADMELDYYINKPNAQAIGNIHSQVNADYLKLQQAVISLGGNT